MSQTCILISVIEILAFRSVNILMTKIEKNRLAVKIKPGQSERILNQSHKLKKSNRAAKNYRVRKRNQQVKQVTKMTKF